MNNFEFISFIETPGEKHLGVATMRLEKRFVFRYKVNPGKDGKGYYIQPPSLKVTLYGQDKYLSAFQPDSVSEADEIKSFMEFNINAYFKNKGNPVNAQNSALAFPTPIQNPQGHMMAAPNANLASHGKSGGSEATQEEMPF